jgi:hypothetical protein
VKLRAWEAADNPANWDAAKWRGSCSVRGNRNRLCSFGMSRADEYRKRAEAAEAGAQAMSLSDHRRHMLELAAIWRELADEEQADEPLLWRPDDAHG